MSGHFLHWWQADRQRGAGWSFAHLFWTDQATGNPTVTVCGYDPARLPNFGPDGLRFRPAPAEASRCSRCEGGPTAPLGTLYYPLGEHPDDVAARAGTPDA